MAEKYNVMLKMLGRGLENYDKNVSTRNCTKWFVESQLTKNLQNYIKFLMDHLTRCIKQWRPRQFLLSRPERKRNVGRPRLKWLAAAEL